MMNLFGNQEGKQWDGMMMMIIMKKNEIVKKLEMKVEKILS